LCIIARDITYIRMWGLPQEGVTYLKKKSSNFRLLVIVDKSLNISLKSVHIIIVRDITYISMWGVGLPHEGVIYFFIFLPSTSLLVIVDKLMNIL